MTENKSEFKNIIQRLCLPPDDSFPRNLFFREYGLVGSLKANIFEYSRIRAKSLFIPEGEQVCFDTYFNLFPLFKWIRYTRISDLRVNIVLKGEAQAALMGIFKDDPKKDYLVCEETLSSGSEKSFCLFSCGDLSDMPDFLYLDIRARAGGAKISDIYFSTSAEADENINLACCFCTYKREKDIKKNIENLSGGIIKNIRSPLYGRLEIYIADNGNSLPDELSSEEGIHLFYNKNYGGSSGFARCMIEACFNDPQKPFSHLILMDDDALVIPEAVERTGALAGLLKAEYRSYMIGGGFLSKDDLSLQKENGAFLNVENVRTMVCGLNMDMGSRANAIANELSGEEEVNYNGWWYTAIPANLITKESLPLPCFIHRDDEEFGIRNGGKFIRLNGICIWHPDLRGLSKIKPYVDYYGWRNILIVQSLYCPERKPKDALALFTRAVFARLLNYNYKAALYICRAFEDFYKGIDFFKETDAEGLNGRLMKNGSHEAIDLSGKNLISLKSSNPKEDRQPFTEKQLKKRKIRNWFVRASKKRLIYGDGTVWKEMDFYKAKEVCVIDLKTRKGIVLKKNYRQAFKVLGSYMRIAFKILRKHKKIYKNWCEEAGYLKTYDFWKNYLDL